MTETYRFHGNLVPSASPPNIPSPIPFDSSFEGLDHRKYRDWGEMQFSGNQVDMAFATDQPWVALADLKVRVQGLIESVLDANAYLTGYAHIVEFDSVIKPDGSTTRFGLGADVIANTAADRPGNLGAVSEVLGLVPSFARVLADLRLALVLSRDSGYFCYRAMETIKNEFLGAGQNDNAAWEELRRVLRVERPWIYAVKALADKPRHGHWQVIMGPERAEALLKTWRVVDRFCMYVHLGRQPLSAQQFPMLVARS